MNSHQFFLKCLTYLFDRAIFASAFEARPKRIILNIFRLFSKK